VPRVAKGNASREAVSERCFLPFSKKDKSESGQMFHNSIELNVLNVIQSARNYPDAQFELLTKVVTKEVCLQLRRNGNRAYTSEKKTDTPGGAESPNWKRKKKFQYISYSIRKKKISFYL